MNRLKKLSISNFRGFYNKQVVNFAIPEEHGSGLTIIVGPNNSGKTTLIESLRKFSHDLPQLEKEERHNQDKTEIKLTNSNGEEKTLSNPQGSVCVIEDKEIYPKSTDFYLVSSRRYWTTYFGTNKLSHFDHKRFSLNIDRFGGDSNFGQRMIEIQENADLKKEYDLIIKKLIPNFSSWHIELSRGQNYIEYVTGNGDMHNSEFFGDGVISLFKIALTLLSDQSDEILIIDEPELSLHPQAQKILIQTLSEHSLKKQIILTTHSPYFVVWEDIEKGAKIIRLNKPFDKKCMVNELEDIASYKNLVNLKYDWQKPHVLDIVAKEVFFSTNIVFVEGQEDMSLISKFSKNNGIKLNFELFGYGAGGSGNIYTFLKMANDLGLKGGAIFDGNEKENYNKCKKDFPDFCIEKISKDDIRDKKEKDFFDGLFEENGQIKKEKEEEELKGLIEKIIKFFNKL